MKRFLKYFLPVLAMVLLVAGSPSENYTKRWTTIISADGVPKQITASCTSEAFAINNYKGAITLALYGDTLSHNGLPDLDAAANVPIYVKLRLKEASDNPNDQRGWMTYYKGAIVYKGDATLGAFTADGTLDTIPRAVVNAGNFNVYMVLANYENWGWADSAQIILTATDSVNVLGKVAGQ